jgi:glucose-1-phosphate thymidylyltransferase
MKGVLIAGGSGSRLSPVTAAISKQLLPIYDKPLIYYPLTTLMLAGVTEICIVVAPENRNLFEKLLGSGNQWGIKIIITEQTKPLGIANALKFLPEHFFEESLFVVLGDNFIYGTGLGTSLKNAFNQKGALIFAHKVHNPEDFGVITLDKAGNPVEIVEKPTNPKSKLAIPGLYFFDTKLKGYLENIEQSNRGEFEITSVLNKYLSENKLQVNILERGVAWLDTGTPSALLSAGEFVQIIEKRQGLKIGCPEEIALESGFISKIQLENHLKSLPDNEYKTYLSNLLDSDRF